jgi:PAS domain S-box-containing protein
MTKILTQYLKNGKSLLLVYILLIISLVITISTRKKNARQAISECNEIVNNSARKLTLISELRKNSSQAQIYLLHNILEENRSEAKSTIAKIDGIVRFNGVLLSELAKLTSDSAEAALLKEVNDTRADNIRTRDTLLRIGRVENPDKALQYLHTIQSVAYTIYHNAISRLSDYVETQTHERQAKANAMVNNALRNIFFLLSATLLLLLLLGLLIVRTVMKIQIDSNRSIENAKNLIDYKDALDQSSIVSITDNNGIIKYVNNKFCEESKYSREELIGQTHRIVNSGYHPEGFFSSLWSTISGGQIWRGEVRNKAKDGEYFWTAATIVPFIDNKTKKPYQYVAIRNDITQSKLATEALQKSEEKFRHIFENSTVGKALTTPDAKFLQVNSALATMLGYTVKELEQLDFFRLTHPDDVNISKDAIASILAKEKLSCQFEKRYLHKNGSIVWASVGATAVCDKNGVLQYFITSISDITEKKRDEQRLNDLTDRLLLATDSAKMGIWDWDIKNDKLVWEDNMFRMFNVPRDKFTNDFEAWRSSIHPDDLQGTLNEVKAALEGSDDYHTTFRIIWPNEEVHYMEGHAIILRNDEGKAVRMIGLSRDITNQKESEILKEKISADILQRNKDLQQFTYIVSHNLRAPVANIKGLTESLMTTNPDENEKEELIFNLAASVSKLNRVILDMNQILQIKNNVSERKELVSFSHLIKNIRISIGDQIKTNDVELITDFSKVDKMMVFKSYLYSIMFNLISNSIKYRREGIKPVIEVASIKEKNKITLVFKDNCLGIDLAKKGEQVFGLYKRFHTHTEGKGMGLYMVKTQVETLGGKISVSSEVNKGTEFRIEFDNYEN